MKGSGVARMGCVVVGVEEGTIVRLEECVKGVGSCSCNYTGFGEIDCVVDLGGNRRFGGGLIAALSEVWCLQIVCSRRGVSLMTRLWSRHWGQIVVGDRTGEESLAWILVRKVHLGWVQRSGVSRHVGWACGQLGIGGLSDVDLCVLAWVELEEVRREA